MQKAKETASTAAASANAGMEKSKATMQEKREKMTTRDAAEKEMATEKKQEKFNEAEWNKQQTREHSTALRQAATGQPMGEQQLPVLPGHNTGQPKGHVTDNTRVGGDPTNTGNETGRAYH